MTYEKNTLNCSRFSNDGLFRITTGNQQREKLLHHGSTTLDAGRAKRGSGTQDQLWEIILVVQGKPLWQRLVGPPQAIISQKLVQNLVRRRRKHQVIKRGSQNQEQQGSNPDQGLQIFPTGHQVPTLCPIITCLS